MDIYYDYHKEIAEMAGVSMTTVYNVLHGNVKKVSKNAI